MNRIAQRVISSCVAVCGLLAIASLYGQELFDVPLENPSFSKGVDGNQIPLAWSKYGGGGTDQSLNIEGGPNEAKWLLIEDGDPSMEIGVFQAFDLKGDETYRVTVKVRGVEGDSTDGAHVQLRFLPSNQLVQTGLDAKSTTDFSEVSVKGTAPPGTTRGVIYLYTHRDPTPKVIVSDVKLVGGLPPPPPPPPAPIPPQYDRLKDLHQQIRLVAGGKPNAAIVVPALGDYRNAATAVQQAIEQCSGVSVPIVSDDTLLAAVPIKGNLIVLGNRSTNKTIRALYDRYCCLVDLKYPGPKGYVIRSVHNPFGDGNSVLVIGGSDAVGVQRGASAFADMLSKRSTQRGELSVGWTMQTQLGEGVEPPTDIRKFETWEASRGYGSSGYFGWCSISKRMAMYYMTGDEFSAREFVRLAFPDEQAIRDIEEIDGERIENKHDPLAGFYHYNAHMAILFWDLIEESPVFSDEERLKITNAFSRQLEHRKNEGVYGLTHSRSSVGSRHGQWSAISLYCLGRYFDKDYPDPIWAQCIRGGELAFGSLHEHAWVAGESDNLFWYNTGIAPIFTYLVLTGDRKPLENGVIDTLLRGQEALLSGRDNDWALRSASLGLLHKAAYVTGDDRWLAYRERTGVDTNVFRLGQSFWPDEAKTADLPDDLASKWTVLPLPKPAWTARHSGLPFDQSFYFGSYRSAADASGDFILLDGFNGASRNPYHTFDLLQLRLAGRTILDGYHNQVLTSADGMVEPSVAMDAALLHADVVGQTAMAVGEVPDAAFCNWRRSLVQRTGRYALVVDDLTFRTDSQNMATTTTWQSAGGRWDSKTQAIRIPSANAAAGFQLQSCDQQEVHGSRVVTMTANNAVQQGGKRTVFYLIGPTAAESRAVVPTAQKQLRQLFYTGTIPSVASFTCVRVADNAAALSLPDSALAVVGEHGLASGELVVLAEDHLYGHNLVDAGIDDGVVSSVPPVDIDWDFDEGVIHVVASQPTDLRLKLSATDALRVRGEPVRVQVADGMSRISLSEGRYVFTDAAPDVEVRKRLGDRLRRLLEEGRMLRTEQLADDAEAGRSIAAALPMMMIGQAGAPVSDMVTVPTSNGPRLAVSAGNRIHLFTPDDVGAGELETDGKIRMLHWWNEPQLLLAGCVDEKVIAFDSKGIRRWTFTSEMDPAVYEAAKTYWFKSAPGHEGIHGLHTGEFDEGESRCFVGSACTLEILDEDGQLVKRTPVFWGPGRMFLMVDGPGNSKNLLISRWRNGNDHLAIVNSRTMAVTGHGYNGVPRGHSHVGGWTAQNRTGLFYEDLDGDGRKEVATAINGTWNRVTVYSKDGSPLYNAQFGPGASNALRARMREMDVADLDGDGKKEMVVGISEGLVVALGGDCRRIWSTRLSSPPVSLRCVGGDGSKHPRIVVGCEDGSVLELDSRGGIVRAGSVTGRPTHMQVVETDGGPMIVLATDKGDVSRCREPSGTYFPTR